MDSTDKDKSPTTSGPSNLNSLPLTKEAIETSFYGHEDLTALLSNPGQDLQHASKTDAGLFGTDVDHDAPIAYNSELDHKSNSGITCVESDNCGDSETINEEQRHKYIKIVEKKIKPTQVNSPPISTLKIFNNLFVGDKITG